ALFLAPFALGAGIDGEPGGVSEDLSNGAGMSGRRVDHGAVIGDAVGNIEHGILAATVDSERGADPEIALDAMQGGSEPAGTIGEGLNGNTVGRPVFGIDREFLKDGVHESGRSRHDGLDLEGISDGDDAGGSPDRSDSGLGSGLPRLVDEEPANLFSTQGAEQARDRGKGRGDDGDDQE